MSLAVYGGLAVVLGALLARPARIMLIAGAALLAVAIAVSRVMLHHHSPLEVVVGLAVGGTALAAIIAVVVRYPPAHLPLGRLALAAAIVALLFHGERWPAERAIHRLAGVDLVRPWCG